MSLPWLLCYGDYYGLEGMHVGMPWLLQRATGAALATCLLEGLFSQLKVFSKRRFCYQRVGQCWPWQRAHGVAFVLAYGGFLGFDCVPKPWLLPHCGFVNMHFGHAMA